MASRVWLPRSTMLNGLGGLALELVISPTVFFVTLSLKFSSSGRVSTVSRLIADLYGPSIETPLAPGDLSLSCKASGDRLSMISLLSHHQKS